MVSVEPKQRSKSFGICIIYGLYVHKICQGGTHTHTHPNIRNVFGEELHAKNRCVEGNFSKNLKSLIHVNVLPIFMTLLIHQRVIFSMNV